MSVKNLYNPVEYLINKYPDKKWNYLALSANMNLNYNIISNSDSIILDIIPYHRFGPGNILTKYKLNVVWSHYYMNRNNNNIIENFIDMDWKIYHYSQFVKKNIDKFPIKHFLPMDMAFGDVNGILDILRKYPNPKWRISTLSMNSKITMKIIKNNMDIKWDWKLLSYNSNITMKDIEDNLNMPWRWNYILYNPNISINMIEKYPSKRWNFIKYINNYKYINRVDAIIPYILEQCQYNKLDFSTMFCYATMEIIKRYPNIKWGWYIVSRSDGIKMEDIENNIDLPWDFSMISLNPNLTIKFVKNHINESRDWDWDFISSNSNITMEDIENNPKLPWNFDYISRNINLTVKFIEKNLNKPWNWPRISSNHFITDIQINAKNKIYICWKKRKIRYNKYKNEHNEKLKYAMAELILLPPSKTDNFDFKGGFAYIDTHIHFNSIKN